jgi:RimJ/RimL family protein N-acetyltransferase
MKDVLLKGKGFTLRPYRIGDEVSLAENSLSEAPDLNEIRKWLGDVIGNQKVACVDFAICVDDKAVGHIGGHFEKRHVFAIWYWLGNRFQGKGIMTEVLGLYTKYMFEAFESLHRIEAETTTDNVSSKRVLEKNNFKLEGVMRKGEDFRGELRDKYMFSKLRGE